MITASTNITITNTETNETTNSILIDITEATPEELTALLAPYGCDDEDEESDVDAVTIGVDTVTIGVDAPVFTTNIITEKAAAETKGRKAQAEAIRLYNNLTYIACKKVGGIGMAHVFRASAFAAAGVCRQLGLDVYCLDADLHTEPAYRFPLWAAKSSRLGLRIDASRAASLEEVGFSLIK